MRTIDADDLQKEFDSIANKSATGEWQFIPIKHIKQIIDNAPTVEERPQGEWIPVSERLPDKDGVYLVTRGFVEDSEIDMARFVYSEKDDCNNGFHKTYPIIAWQSLPAPYKTDMKGGAE